MSRGEGKVVNKQGTDKTGVRTHKLNKWFDARSWIDADSIQHSCSTLGSMFKTLKAVLLGESSVHGENGNNFGSFAQMMQELNLDNQAIEQRVRWSLISSWSYLLMTCLTLAYVIYLWISGGWLLGLLSISFVLFLGAMTCRERVRYYQLKNRIISCTASDWWHEFRKGRG